MWRRIVSLVAAAGLVVPLSAAAPAAAASREARDCIIVGPNYVEEVADCAFLIVSLLIRT